MSNRWKAAIVRIRTVLWIIGCVPIVGAVMVLLNPRWRGPAFSLFIRAWREFLFTEGSSTIGMFSNWATPIIAVVITIALIRHHRGQIAMEQHWKQEAAIAIRVVVMVAVIIYGPVLIWKCVEALYAEHAALEASREVNHRVQGCWMANLGMKPPANAPVGMRSGDIVVFWCGTDYEQIVSIEWDFNKAPKRIGVPFFTDIAAFAAHVQFTGMKVVAYMDKSRLTMFEPVALDIFSDEKLSPQATEITIRLLGTC